MGDDVAPAPPGAHPRVSGENLTAFQAPDHRPGSSPRERGKRAGVAAEDLKERLIPA